MKLGLKMKEGRERTGELEALKLGLKLRRREEREGKRWLRRSIIAGALELGPTASDPHKTNHLNFTYAAAFAA